MQRQRCTFGRLLIARDAEPAPIPKHARLQPRLGRSRNRASHATLLPLRRGKATAHGNARGHRRIAETAACPLRSAWLDLTRTGPPCR